MGRGLMLKTSGNYETKKLCIHANYKKPFYNSNHYKVAQVQHTSIVVSPFHELCSLVLWTPRVYIHVLQLSTYSSSLQCAFGCKIYHPFSPTLGSRLDHLMNMFRLSTSK